MRILLWIIILLPTLATAKLLDSSKVVGPEECAECHEASVKIWRNTHHAKTFKAMPRTKEAKAIAKTLNIRRIKTDDTCADCHFTRMVKNSNKEKAIAGISCESCHGPAKDWLKVHNDYGGKNVKKQNESAAHKQQRINNAVKGGMVRPGNLYAIYKSCYQCHTVANEKLVNSTKHQAGSDFELVKWSNGEIRHNVFHTGGKSNPKDNAAKKKLKYVLGQALDLEYALRGLAKATVDGKYSRAMIKRAKAALAELEKLNAKESSSEVTAIIAAATSANLAANNAKALKASADKIASHTKKLK